MQNAYLLKTFYEFTQQYPPMLQIISDTNLLALSYLLM